MPSCTSRCVAPVDVACQGTFATTPQLDGESSCRPCSPGEYSGSDGASECSQCQPGQALVCAGSDCVRTGKFSKTVGSTNCTDCSPGSFSTQGALSCIQCQNSYYAGPAATGNLPNLLSHSCMNYDTACVLCARG